MSMRPRFRLAREDGYIMMLALGVMLVTMLILAAVFTAVEADAPLSGANLNGKRAYSAAQAGLQAYLGQLNENADSSSWWQTCANDTATNVAVPGTTGETYSYQPVINQGDSSSYCANAGAIGTVVDPSVGLLRMEFTGYAGNAQARTIVADFRPITPLGYLWYTVHETANPAVSGDSNCPSGTSDYYTDSSIPSNCWIYWASGDSVNGPMYTQDQFLIQQGSTPTFGRANSNDSIASPNPSLCVISNGQSQPAQDTTDATTCPAGVVQGKAAFGAATVPLPTSNVNLQTDAAKYGVTLPAGTTTLALSVSGSTTYGTAVTCTTSSSSSCQTNTYNLTSNPIVYAPTVSGASCSASSYNPYTTTYSQIGGSSSYANDFYGGCGDLYVTGTYTSSLTLASANSIVVVNNLENSSDANGSTRPTGNATLGLVANAWVRIYHPVTFQYQNGQPVSCSGSAPNVTVDAAILALNDSFYVDNFECGSTGTLTIHGSIAQQFRGAVATSNGNGGVGTGYQKNYVYDDRLKIILPSFLFDLQNTSWDVVRETLCASGQPASSIQSCSYTGNNG